MHSRRMHTAHSSSHQGGSASVHAGIDPPGVGLETPWPDPPQLPSWVWAWRPPWPDPPQLPLVCGPGDPPGQISLNFTLGCGPGNLQGMLGYHPTADLLQGMLGYHLQCMLRYHHPSTMDRMTDTCKNITCANFICGW